MKEKSYPLCLLKQSWHIFFHCARLVIDRLHSLEFCNLPKGDTARWLCAVACPSGKHHIQLYGKAEAHLTRPVFKFARRQHFHYALPFTFKRLATYRPPLLHNTTSLTCLEKGLEALQAVHRKDVSG